MSARRYRLDRFISQHSRFNRKDIRLLLAQQRILIDGVAASSINQVVDGFNRIELDGQVLADTQPLYIMLNKPVDVVTAVKDDEHQTVMDLIDHPHRDSLHHAGRLDLNTSGLLLLTNDGRFSRLLTHPDYHICKRYLVTLADPVTDEYTRVFQQGIYFAYEDTITRPAELEILSPYQCIMTLTEGRYHQVKRMFGYFRNRVTALHRLSMGSLALDSKLLPGQWRELTANELKGLHADFTEAEKIEQEEATEDF
ncbi:pseudouridine synthase [Oceanospirillum sediminis]|uniref:Pseudouridine synthase n=1 Tax=Oceanospirillum sediminis TaxID=2760088 RepID=A0A839IRZ7_9GAMM|nr:16S rRNA pseudouridine(516) synthase [Oceanospirillum sediminis]MBB1487738.1 pseudouridine synthase [Oceanospirillum sediminis]